MKNILEKKLFQVGNTIENGEYKYLYSNNTLLTIDWMVFLFSISTPLTTGKRYTGKFFEQKQDNINYSKENDE